MPGALIGSSSARTLRLTHLELEGFKSFRDKAIIGPLDDFTCVVGPNGCGKSVVGEAVAFALGGNRKMLRTGNLAGLLNQELAAAGHKTAEVVLHLEVLAVPETVMHASTRPMLPHATAPTELQLPPASSTLQPDDAPHSLDNGSSTKSGQQGQQPQAAFSQLQQAPVQQLKLKRVLRGDTTKGYIMRPGSSSWSAVSQAQLQAELAPYGIDTQVVDRYIVTQSRQAVDVGDAVGLVKQLEALTGAVDYEAAIQQHSALLEQLAAGMEDTKAQMGRLEDQRELLAPAVAHWRQVQEMEQEVTCTKLQLLVDQQEHGSLQLRAQQQQVSSAEATVAAKAAALGAAEERHAELQQQRAAVDKQLLAAQRREEALQKQVTKLAAAAAAKEVQHAAAATGLQEHEALLKALHKKLDQHDRQEALHKASIERQQQRLRQLQEASTAAQDALASARRSAAVEARAWAAKVPSKHSTAKQVQKQQKLQQELAELDCQLQLSTACQAAAAAKATRAAKSVGALQQKASAAEAAAAESDRLYAAAEQEVQAAAAAVAASRARSTAAEQEWRSAELQRQSLMEQLEEAQAQQQSGQSSHSHHPNNAPGAWPAYDTAVQQLSSASVAGQLPGTFYGRLCNLAAVSEPLAQLAVNAALQERCNLATMLVVSDRPTAAAIIEHFRQHRVGTVNCRILSELQQQQQQGVVQASVAAPVAGYASRALLQLLRFDGQAVPGLQQLMEQLLGGWLLVDTRETALQLLHLKRSMVTRLGEVFKADGEIVASFGSGSSNTSSRHNSSSALPAYSLAIAHPVPISTAPSATQHNGNQQAAAADAKAAAQQLKLLKQQLAAAQQRVQQAMQAVEEAHAALLQHQQQQAAVEAKLLRLQQQQQRALQARGSSGMHTEQLHQQLQDALRQQHAADAELATAGEALEIGQAQRKQLLQQQRQGANRESDEQHASDGSGDASPAAAEFAAAQQAASEAAAAVEAAWQEVHKAEQQQKRAASRAAAIAKEIAKARTAADAAAVEKLQADLQGIEQQLSAAKSELQQVKSEAASISSEAKSLRQQVSKAAAAKDKAAVALQAVQADLQQAQTALRSLQKQQEHRAQRLRELQAKLATAHAAEEVLPAAAASDTSGDAAAVAVQLEQEQGSKRAKTAADSQEPSGLADAALQGQELQPQDAATAAAGHDDVMEVDQDASAPDRSGSVQPAGRQRKPHSASGTRKKLAVRSNRQGSRAASCRRRTRTQVIADSSSSASSGSDADSGASSSSSSDSDSDSEEHQEALAARVKRTAAAGARGNTRAAAAAQLRKKQHITGSDADAGEDGQQQPRVPSAAVLAKQAAALRQRQQLLDEQAQELQQQFALVDSSALEQDLTALQGLAAAHSALQQLQQQHEAAAAALEQLLDERYARLLSVLQALNAKLEAVYSQLSGGRGKAYCSYTAERRLLFSQGVTLHVQPDGSMWRRLAMLSGGQQSLATLALSFALQALFPSPLYFFDEVDCALDTSAAARVAAYVRQQCSGPTAAQYLLVSHKPLVFESAGCLLGVYSNGRGSSAAVVGHFLLACNKT